MQTKNLHYVFAALSFLVALITYTITMQPTIPFWDCGEFASAAWALQISHPPGAPLHTLFGRVFMMLPFFDDLVARFNFLSVLSSATTVLLLYLTVARLIRIWRGEAHTKADAITSYGGALVAALCYTFTDSFWFNALESEVYAFGSLFVALVPWLILVWYDRAEEEHSEKWLLLIFYVIGLSMGVQQIGMITIFPLFMLVYYRRTPNVTMRGWLIMGVLATVAFFIAYKVVLSWLVQWTGSDMGWLTVLCLGGAIYGIWWSQKNRKPIWNLALWAGLLIFMGYSTYSVLMVRASQNPPMNQWKVSSFERMTKYINREQYGEAKMLPRRNEIYKDDPQYRPTWENYSSDFDFFWRYQTNHMYNRYFLWNFVGRQSDVQDSGVDFKDTLAIPLLLGLFGLYWHFRRDPKRALSLLAMFIAMGVVTAWYQNQQDPQPRERDYFYVSSFSVFAMWVGIGATGIMELIRHKLGAIKDLPPVSSGQSIHGHAADMDTIPVVRGEGRLVPLGLALALTIVLVPLNMALGLAGMLMGESYEDSAKWAMYTRNNNYIPYDYAYNILQSCEPNAILFTAGDNDTFPLWCIQDVYGVRQDVRIVNLSLGKMGWYIEQLKNQEPWGAKKVKLTYFSDEMLRAEEDTERGVRPVRSPAQEAVVPISAETMRRFTNDPNAAAGEMRWNFTGEMKMGDDQIYMVSDLLVRDIIMNNIEDRPIYFATVVPSSYMIGLDNHLSYEGLAARVTPIRGEMSRRGLEVPVNEALYRAVAFNEVKTPSLTPQRGLIVRSYNDPTSGRSSLDDRYGVQTYTFLFTWLANHYLTKGNTADAIKSLDRLMSLLPPENVEYDPSFLSAVASTYSRAGAGEKAIRLLRIANEQVSATPADPNSEEDMRLRFSLEYDMADAYVNSNKFDSARIFYERMRSKVGEGPDRTLLDYKIAYVEARKVDVAGNTVDAAKRYGEIIQKYSNVASSGGAPEWNDIVARHAQLTGGGARTTDTAAK